MRFAFVSAGSIDKYATTYRALYLGKYLAKEGHEVHLFVEISENDKTKYGNSWNGINIHYVKSKPWQAYKKYDLMEKHNFDFVHCLKPALKSLPACLRYKKKKGCKLILDLDEWESKLTNFPTNKLIEKLEKTGVKRCDLLIVVSSFLKQRFKNKERLLYLPNAVDVDINKQRYEEKGENYVTFSGNFLPQYKPKHLAKMVKFACSQINSNFLLIGNGPLQKKVEEVLKKETKEGRVKFTGFLPHKELLNRLCASKALIFPIENNIINQARCPVKTYEYLSTLKPVITNNVGEVGKVFKEIGLFFDYHSKESFVLALKKAEDKKTRKKIMRLSKNKLKENTWKKRFKEYKEAVLN